MILDWSRAPLSDGLACYRQAQFFDAHEHWELVWLTLDEPEKSFLQALIQITAAMHHLRKGNSTGAVSLLHRSLRRLAKCPTIFGGIDVDRLREEVEETLKAISRGSQNGTNIHPKIRLVIARPD